jgi:predicted DNA-binding transcriptional regulator AlpA
MSPTITAPRAPRLEPLLNVSEVAAFLQQKLSWVRAHASGARRPVLPSVKLGKFVLFRRADVEGFVEACCR